MIYNANSFVISFDYLIYDGVMKSKTRLSSDEIIYISILLAIVKANLN